MVRALERPGRRRVEQIEKNIQDIRKQIEKNNQDLRKQIEEERQDLMEQHEKSREDIRKQHEKSREDITKQIEKERQYHTKKFLKSSEDHTKLIEKKRQYLTKSREDLTTQITGEAIVGAKQTIFGFGGVGGPTTIHQTNSPTTINIEKIQMIHNYDRTQGNGADRKRKA